MVRNVALLLGLIATQAAGGAAVASAAAPASFADTVKPLVEAHCVDCHGEDEPKGGLRLDTLAADWHDEHSSSQWTRVLDKLASGEMPPKSRRQRPPAEQVRSTTQFLQAQLHAASLDRQKRNGRVVVRRLNGTEYENTLHDLLGTDVALKEVLPEDNSAGGFDNVSSALDLSSTHLLLYQEAAAKAIASVVPAHPPIPFSDRRTGLDMTKKGPNFKQTLGRSCKLQGDALVFYSKLPRYGLCATGPVPAAGRYRVRMSACAVGAEAKPIPVGLMTVDGGREPPVLKEVREIPHGKPQVIELEFDLDRRQAFVVNLLTQWDIRDFKRPIDEYAGPGLMVEWMEIEGPIDAFPGPGYDALFAGVPLKARSVAKAEADGAPPPKIPASRTEPQWQNDPLVPVSADPRRDADRLIRDFLPRAFRRPVGKEVQDHFVGRVLKKLDERYSFYDAMQYGYKLILCSPDFLFLLDNTAPQADASGALPSTRLDDYSLAQRLSYFLWSGPPDKELLAAAAKGELGKPSVLRAQVERMLNAPRARRFTRNFAGQWLDLRKIDATIPDPKLFPDFDALLLWSMPQETERFFDEVLRGDRSLLEFVHSDWSMLNERLATLYGVPGVAGNAFRKVALPPEAHRGGVMTQASVLKVTADGTRTSPVLRGVWVLERILGKHPSPPPPEAGTIEPDIRGATTIRQQLDKHRNTPACASCHVHIDPPGFALETFDPIGNWRDFYRVTVRIDRKTEQLRHLGSPPVYRGPDVETGGTTHDGRAFESIDEYKRLLLDDKDQIARALAEKLLVYSTGAEVQFADREVVEGIVAAVRPKNYGFRTLIHEVVQSRAFLNK